jgi:hypothetical protein
MGGVGNTVVLLLQALEQTRSAETVFAGIDLFRIQCRELKAPAAVRPFAVFANEFVAATGALFLT